MKIRLHPFSKCQGSALIITAVIAVFVGGLLAAYLLMIENEHRAVARAQTWNTSLVMAEAGVEEGMALINKYEGTGTQISNWVNSAVSQDHWTEVVNTATLQVFTNSRIIDTNIGYYAVYVTNVVVTGATGTTNFPSILSVGTAYWPLSSTPPPAQRKIFVQTMPDANVTGGLISKTVMTLDGNNSVDSYDSTDSTKSFWHANWFFNGHNFGTYTNALRTAEAVVGTDGNLITLNGGDLIYGYVDTGPNGSDTLHGQASVGDVAWVNGGNTGIQPGHSKNDMNVVFTDVVLPTPTNSYYPNSSYPNGKWLNPADYTGGGTNIGGITYYYMITNITTQPGTSTNKIYYQLDSSTIPNNKSSVFINASNIVLYLTNGINLKSANGLTLNTNNSSVEIYTGATFDTGNGAVNNYYQYAPPFKIYGLPSCTSIVFPGNASLTAWINAPEADVTFNGGGSSPYDIAGAFTVHSIELKGHMNFHFDVVLKTYLPPYRYVPTVWKEIPVSGGNAF